MVQGGSGEGVDCVVIGHAALDYVYRIESFPEQPTKVRALQHVESGGGMAANAAATVGRLAGRVELWSRVGGDAAGGRIRKALEDAGVKTTYVRTFDAARSSTAAVIVDRAGERLIVGERDHAMPLRPDWLPLGHIRRAGAVLSDLSWKEATLVAFEEARAHGVATLADVDLGCGVLPEDIVAVTDYVVFSAAALERFATGTTTEGRLSGLLARGVRHVGVTLGSQGYRWLDRGGGFHHQPSFPVEVVDTTGAGDAFHGAFAWAVAKGVPEDECARVAAAAAALSCRGLGARAGLPTRDEVDAFLRERTGHGLPASLGGERPA